MRLAQMERIAHRLDHIEPDLMRDLHELRAAQYGDRTTKSWMRDIEDSGVPVGLSGGLMGLERNPVTKDQTTVTGSATEQAIIPTALLTYKQDVQSGTVYRLYASGRSTTAATPGTYTLAARAGSAAAATNASPLFGAVSGALTPVASATSAQWKLLGYIVIRGSGSANTAVASFEFNHSGTVGGGGPVSATGNAIFGGVSASFDSTAAGGTFWIGVTHATSTTNTWIPETVNWASLN